MRWKPSTQCHIALAALLPAAALLLAGCGDGKSDTVEAAKPATRTSHTPSQPPPPPTKSPANPKAANGTNLGACKDGDCEVEIKTGDVIRFGSRVKTKPRVDALMVVGVTSDGPTFALSSGMTTTAYGTIEINNGIRVETVSADGKRAVVNISRIR
ncbi:MAG: hypothetical protein GEV03_05805 [Streptosporangiales bacterium]|nr:hypothetical protein [Streptosporangiales bacterium]